MSSLWDISTDTVVTALIVVGIGTLVIAWIFAGRRRPAATSELEQRRLAGREAEVVTASSYSLAADTAEPVPHPASSQFHETPALEEFAEVAPLAAVEQSDPTLLALDPLAEPDPAPELDSPPVAAQTATPRSPEQASAMSIAAALVRHDKRDPAPLDEKAQDVQPQPANCIEGDDLTAITGIDHSLAKEMNDLGVRYFDQISDWSPDHAAWIATRLSSPATNAQRNAWIAEAKVLSGQSPSAGHSRVSHGH